MSSIPAYPSIQTLGHRFVLDIFKDPVQIEEKVDGSQLSARVSETGELTVRSKGRELCVPCEDKLFAGAVNTFLQLKNKLIPSTIYRGEVISRPKHNALTYGRVPVGNIILFDMDDGGQNYFSAEKRAAEAERLGLETVPVFYTGLVESFDQFKSLLDRESVLGGARIEGVVIKNYARFTDDAKVMMAKFVSEEFKEKHRIEWKQANPGKSDLIQNIIAIYRHENRWLKAIQHLREQGLLQDAPQDIPLLMKEVGLDIMKEEKEAIEKILLEKTWPKIKAGVVRGLPEFYKEYLAKQSFDGEKEKGS